MKYSLVAAALVAVVNAQGIPLWGQCGGIGYNGKTYCVSGATCTIYNDYFHQCTPSTAEPSNPCTAGCYTHTATATTRPTSCPPLTCPPGGNACSSTSTTTIPGPHTLCPTTPTTTATITAPCESTCPPCVSSPPITHTGPAPTLCATTTACPSCTTATYTVSTYLTRCVTTCSPPSCRTTSTVTVPGYNPGCTTTPYTQVTETISGTEHCRKQCTDCWLPKEYVTADDLVCTPATATATATTTGYPQPAETWESKTYTYPY